MSRPLCGSAQCRTNLVGAIGMDSLINELALARAAQLARAGRYEQAQQILFDICDEQQATAGHLDLLARIHAQQGKLLAADVCWARAREIHGYNDAYEAGRRRITTIQARAASPWHSFRPTRLAVVVVSLTALIVVLLWPVRSVDRLAAQINELEQRLPAESAQADRVLPLVQADLSIPGILPQVRPNSLIVNFSTGLFRAGAVLTPEGERVLSDVARRLAPHAGRVSISVVGHTDDVPLTGAGRYRDNIDLGLARALSAAKQLSASSGIPLDNFALSSTGSDGAPFSNDTSEGRVKNRTVTLKVSALLQ